MMPFELSRRTQLTADEAWRRVTTWDRHGDAIPLTRVSRLPGPQQGVGSRFVARTSLGRLGFDDVMEVVVWEPPHETGDGPRSEDAGGFCRVEKRGRVISGWAEITVAPTSQGSDLSWREYAVIARAGRLGNVPGRFIGGLFFGRLVDRLLADPS